MKIFISWSGVRSRLVAQALHDWIPLVLHFAEPWSSGKNIEAGGRWTVELGKGLQDSEFGLIVITPENLNEPWILFEAGALSTAFSATGVCPYLVDVEFRDLSGPLSQFQAKKAEKQSTIELLESINGRATKPIDPTRLAELSDALWPSLERKLVTLPPPSESPQPSRSQSEVMEELVEAVRRMDLRLDALQIQPINYEVVMTSGMLRSAKKIGIEALYNGREEEWHRDVARAIANARGPIRIAGISLADVCGYWGGRSALHEEIEKRMASPGEDDTLQILFADPEGEGLRLRAKFEHPGITYEETRTYKQTLAKIQETLEIASSAIQSGKVEVKVYRATPMCFLIITEDHLFVEHYHYAGRGGQNIMLAIKGATSLFHAYQDHFDAMWRDARSTNRRGGNESEASFDKRNEC